MLYALNSLWASLGEKRFLAPFPFPTGMRLSHATSTARGTSSFEISSRSQSKGGTMCCPLLTGALGWVTPFIVFWASYVRNEETCLASPEETTGKTRWS